MMPDFSLKAAAIDYDQLADRASRLERAGLPVRIELHTFGDRDVESNEGRKQVFENIQRLREVYGDVELVVHVPYQSVQQITKIDFDKEQVKNSIDLAHEVDARAVVMHRYWGLTFGDAPSRSSRKEATAGFNEVMRELSAYAEDMCLLVENVGHFSLLPRDGKNFLSGPLDHFFPWEIKDFREYLHAEGLSNVDVFVDVAHATLSANIFNICHRYPHYREEDPRFRWVTQTDLEQCSSLHPFEFVDREMTYMHASDSHLLTSVDMDGPVISENLIISATCMEGLEVGSGTLPWSELPTAFSTQRDAVIVLEVEPADGETHLENGAQERSLLKLKDVFENVPALTAGVHH